MSGLASTHVDHNDDRNRDDKEEGGGEGGGGRSDVTSWS